MHTARGILKPTVSVIMPIYNEGRVLAETFECLRLQSYQNLEIVCIDDGSLDDSTEIERNYAKRDDRIRLYLLNHVGAANARNFGLMKAKGKYIIFLDSDDLYHPNFISCMVDALESSNADMCLCESDVFYSLFERPRPHIRFNARFGQGLYQRESFGRDLFQIGYGYPWNKMFRLEFLLQCNLTFQRVRCFNDCLFSAKAISSADTVYLIKSPLVLYRRGLGTSIQDTRYKYSSDALLVAEELYSQLYNEVLTDLEVMSLREKCGTMLVATASGLACINAYDSKIHMRVRRDMQSFGLMNVSILDLGNMKLGLQLLLLKYSNYLGIAWAYRHWKQPVNGKPHSMLRKIELGVRIVTAVIIGMLPKNRQAVDN